MQRTRRIVWWGFVGILVTVLAATAAELAVEKVDPDDLARVEAFVRGAPTFRFDGIEESLRLEAVRRLAFCPGCYEYTLYFESRFPGYGDRRGDLLSPARTPHRAKVLLVNRQVVSGLLDGAWDMVHQLIVDYECTYQP
ncbi:MAG: hypothetical protein KatS3mg131_3328 [Candidatus Tectimicrobiota bacterium]|nr:MAG: hypothetical protein KatS3mg131_3328 [Candidatus Tectomicrobia bacterium]